MSRLQVSEGRRLPELNSRVIGPYNAILIEIEDPDRVFDQLPGGRVDGKCCQRGYFYGLVNRTAPEVGHFNREQASTPYDQNEFFLKTSSPEDNSVGFLPHSFVAENPSIHAGIILIAAVCRERFVVPETFSCGAVRQLDQQCRSDIDHPVR